MEIHVQVTPPHPPIIGKYLKCELPINNNISRKQFRQRRLPDGFQASQTVIVIGSPEPCFCVNYTDGPRSPQFIYKFITVYSMYKQIVKYIMSMLKQT